MSTHSTVLFVLEMHQSSQRRGLGGEWCKRSTKFNDNSSNNSELRFPGLIFMSLEQNKPYEYWCNECIMYEFGCGRVMSSWIQYKVPNQKQCGWRDLRILFNHNVIFNIFTSRRVCATCPLKIAQKIKPPYTTLSNQCNNKVFGKITFQIPRWIKERPFMSKSKKQFCADHKNASNINNPSVI